MNTFESGPLLKANSNYYLRWYIRIIKQPTRFIVLTISLTLLSLASLAISNLSTDVVSLDTSNRSDTNITNVTIHLTAILTTTKNIPTKRFQWRSKCGEVYTEQETGLSTRAQKRLQKRIVGGQEAMPQAWPFIASLRLTINSTSEHHCGATIITDRHVLTAAHCLMIYLRVAVSRGLSIIEMKSLIKVHVGTHSQHVLAKNVFGVDMIEIHKNFNYSEWTLENDIMLLKLDREIVFDNPNVNVVCLPKENSTYSSIFPDREVVAIGWGSTSSSSDHEFPDRLQQTSFRIQDSEGPSCNSGMLSTNNWDKENIICAGASNKVTCFGDSGGPLLQLIKGRWTLVGIISFAHDIKEMSPYRKKCDPSKPFYSANIVKYLTWITDRISH